MSMPKGHKSENGYATVSSIENGLDYRSIAEIMSAEGYKMNHATARNIFLKAMKKLAKPIHELYETETAPLLDWFEERGILKIVDGNGTETDVFDRLTAVIEEIPEK